MPHREEALGKTQDTLEGLCHSAGLRTPREELEEASEEREVWASLLRLLPLLRISGRRWMDGLCSMDLNSNMNCLGWG